MGTQQSTEKASDLPHEVAAQICQVLSTAVRGRLDTTTEKWVLAKVVEGEELW